MTGTSDAIGDDDVDVALEAVQGSAAVGRVVRTGPRAAVLSGKQVLIGPLDPCGECEVCRRGGVAACPLAVRRDGFWAERAVVAGRWVTALDRGLELPVPAAAAVAGDVATAYTLYARTGPSPREPVILVGTSPVTRFLVDILRAKDVSPTVVADPADEVWCTHLLARGAAIARVARAASHDEARQVVGATVAAQHAGHEAPARVGRPWRVIATARDAAPRAAALAGARSTLVLLAPVDELPGDLVTREVTVVGVAGAHPDLVVEAAAMCVKGEIDLVDGTTFSTGDPTRSCVAHLGAP